MVQGVGDIDAIWFLDFKPCFVPYKVFDEEWATIVCAIVALSSALNNWHAVTT